MTPSAELRAYYKGKRVLVTGHTGLKGSWLALWLNRLGAEVYGIALPPVSPLSTYSANATEAFTHSEFIDVRDAAAIRQSLERSRPEVVFHLAAQAIVGVSYDDPVATFSTNVLGTAHVLDAIRRTDSVRVAVMITSDKCYENVEQIWGYRETDRMGGDDPYSASKGAAELVIASWSRSFFNTESRVRVASARAGNVIGGGDWSPFRLVPDCIRSLRAEEPIKLRNPIATRPWQFVLEPLAGYLRLGARLASSPSHIGPWNFGPPVDNGNTVEKGASEIIQYWGTGKLEIVGSQFHENTALQLDCTKSRHVLGWRTALDFKETMRWTAEWYQHQHATNDGPMRAFSEQQIETYERQLDRL